MMKNGSKQSGNQRDRNDAIESFMLPLKINFSWTLLGNILYSACRWGMLVVIAKICIPEMVGKFVLGIAVTEPIFMFFNLQLRSVLVTDIKKEFTFNDYLGLRLLTSGIAIVAVFFASIILGYEWSTVVIVIGVGMNKLIDSISDLFYGLLQFHERMDRIAKSMIIKGLSAFIAFSFGVYSTNTVIWGIVGFIAAGIMTLLLYDIRSGFFIIQLNRSILDDPLSKEKTTLMDLMPSWELKTLIKIIKLSLPLGVVMLLLSLNENISKYFIERLLGERELGIFAAMAYLTIIGSTMINALGQAASPRLANYFAVNKFHEYKTLLLRLLGFSVLIGGLGLLIAFFAGKHVLGIIYTIEYAQHNNIFILIMVWAMISYLASFTGYGMTAARCFKPQVLLFSIVLGVTTLACVLFIPPFGLIGVALSIIVGSIVQFVFGSLIIISALNKKKLNTIPISKELETGLST